MIEQTSPLHLLQKYLCFPAKIVTSNQHLFLYRKFTIKIDQQYFQSSLTSSTSTLFKITLDLNLKLNSSILIIYNLEYIFNFIFRVRKFADKHFYYFYYQKVLKLCSIPIVFSIILKYLYIELCNFTQFEKILMKKDPVFSLCFLEPFNLENNCKT